MESRIRKLAGLEEKNGDLTVVEIDDFVSDELLS